MNAKATLKQLTTVISDILGDSAEVGIEFTGRRMEYPIKTLQIATGIRNASVSYAEDSEGNQVKVRHLTVEALICAPKDSVGVTIADAVDGILSAALSADAPKLVKFYTGKASYSASMNAIVQSVYITVEF